MMEHKIGSIVMALVTLVGAGAVTQIEAKASTYAMYAQAENTKQVEILRDHISLLWVAGGAVLGAYVGMAIRKVDGRSEMAKYFAVSLCTSLAAAPYLLKRYSHGAPEECFFGGFLMAVGAWLAWEVVMIIGGRVKDAAQRNGWLGVKREIMGQGEEKKPS